MYLRSVEERGCVFGVDIREGTCSQDKGTRMEYRLVNNTLAADEYIKRSVRRKQSPLTQSCPVRR